MTKSTPRDLAVSFRSMSRRLRDAQDEDTPPESIATAASSIQQAINEAATVLRCAATATAVADAIEARPIPDWTDDDLAAVQSAADKAASAIRGIQNLSPRA